MSSKFGKEENERIEERRKKRGKMEEEEVLTSINSFLLCSALKNRNEENIYDRMKERDKEEDRNEERK